MSEITSQQLREVIADFLNLGHVENIVALYKEDPTCFPLTGELICDERIMVRMGVAVLFEELVQAVAAARLDAAVPSLLAAMGHSAPYVRGDAAHVLATIATPAALAALANFRHDPDPQVAEIANEALASAEP